MLNIVFIMLFSSEQREKPEELCRTLWMVLKHSLMLDLNMPLLQNNILNLDCRIELNCLEDGLKQLMSSVRQDWDLDKLNIKVNIIRNIIIVVLMSV